MSITVGEIFQCLVDDLQNEKLCQENLEIYNSKLLLKNQKQFDSNTLYIGELSDPGNDIPSPVPCFMIIKGRGIPAEQLSRCFTNYAFLNDNSDLFQFFNKVQDLIHREQRLVNSSSALLQSLIKGRGLQYIIDIGYRLLNNPILLVDTSYKLLAYTKNDDVDDPVWNELTSKGYCSYNMVSVFMKEGVVKKIADSIDPLLTDSGFSEKIHRIHGKIMLNNNLIGYLGVLECNQKFKQEDYRIISLLCDVISAQMQKNHHIKGFMYENLLIDLLDNNIKNSEYLQERLKITGLKLEKNLYLIVIDFQNKDISNHHIIDFLRDCVDRMVQHSRSILYKKQIVTFLSLKDSEAEKSIITIEKFLEDNGLQAGLSALFNNILYLHKAYHQAQKALELGSRLRNFKRLFHYTDYRIYHLLTLAGNNCSLTDLAHQAPLELKEYDAQKGTSLYQTLYIYLDTDNNIIHSAEKLFIHRNTMNQRLKKISEITGLDFENFEECVQVYLTYKILEMEH